MVHKLLSTSMPPFKRGALQSPNPVKYAMVDDAESVSDLPEQNQDVVGIQVSSADAADEAPVVAGIGNSSDIPISSTGAYPIAPSVRVDAITCPPSPNKNRERFLNGFTPARTCCNLDLCRAPAGSKFNMSAICIAVFPASRNPDRRYVMLADLTGSVGVTVWNENVNKFGSDAVGKLVCLTKVVIISHHGKKQLSLVRDSSVQLIIDDTHDVFVWWTTLLRLGPVTCGAVHDIADNNIVTVSGICGRVSSEIKMVNSVERTITTIHLVDGSGRCDVKSWNHLPINFLIYVDRPIVIRRVKMSSFAGTKHCELLDGVASVIETEFAGATELQRFWTM
jgi:hypothetical protein